MKKKKLSQIIRLTRSWEDIVGDLYWGDEFDEENFFDVFDKTYQFLKSKRNKKSFDKNVIELLLSIRDFYVMDKGVPRKILACQTLCLVLFGNYVTPPLPKKHTQSSVHYKNREFIFYFDDAKNSVNEDVKWENENDELFRENQ